MATSVSQNGVTLTLATDCTVGQFVNGDYYIVAPSGVNCTYIDPPSTDDGTRIKNGAMVNPAASQSGPQGFDNKAESTSFSAALNAARPGGNDLSDSNPLALSPGDSLVCMISVAATGSSARPQFSDAAVFTVLASPPASGSFRPGYCGTDKRLWNETDLDYTRLKTRQVVTGAPSMATVEANFAKVWIEIITRGSASRVFHPSNNQLVNSGYGQYLAYQTEEAMLLLHSNYTDSEKRTLLIRFVQYGIDIWASAKSGGDWREDGGHSQGRKAPMLFAGFVLNDSEIKWYGDKANFFKFQEDQQCFYVSQAEVDLTHATTSKPIASMTASGTTVTVTTISPHGLGQYANATSKGYYFQISGATPSAYNGRWVVYSTPNSTQFTIHLSSDPGGDATVVGTGEYFTQWHPYFANTSLAYESADIGTPEWGIEHIHEPYSDNASWSARYRTIAGSSFCGHAMAIREFTGGESAWNWPPFFDYCDRYAEIEVPKAKNGTNYIHVFPANYWLAYRNTASSPIPYAPTDLAVSLVGTRKAVVTWTEVANNALYQTLERSAVSGSGFSVIATLPPGVATWEDKLILQRTTYYYRIRASNQDGDSDYTSEASATIGGPVPVIASGGDVF